MQAAYADNTGRQTQTYETASLSQRFFAFLLDSLLIGLVYALVFIIVHTVSPSVERGIGASWRAFFDVDLEWVLILTVDAVYHVYFWTRPSGQTPGKRYVNNRVIKLDGSKLTVGNALIRYGIRWVNGLLLGIGWLRIIFDYEHRGWHDRAAGTLVVLNEPSATADTAPFRPRTLFWGWIPFGIPCVAMMAAVNWRRLGQPERFQPTLLIGLAVALVLIVVISHPVFYQLVPQQSQIPALIVVVVGVSTLHGFIVSRSQLASYNQWRDSNGGKHPTRHETGRKTFGRILLATFGVSIVYSYLLVPLLVNLTAPLLPDRVYTDGAISLTYSGKWWTTTAFADVPFCQQADVLCLIAGRDSVDGTSGLTFELERSSGFSVLFMSAQQADEQTWDAIQAQDAAARTINHAVRDVDGRVMVERHYTSGQLSAVSVYIKDRAGIYRFYAEGPNQLFNQRLMELEEIIDSLHFVAQI